MITPVLGFVVTEELFKLLTELEVMTPTSIGVGYEKRLRTTALIAICFSLIPFNIAKNKRWDDTLRGIVFPTLIYVGYWVYRFGKDLY